MTREEALKTLEGLQDQYTIAGEVVTDEAVDIMLKRLEVMKDENRTD